MENKDSPLYKNILKELIYQIESGKLKANQKLPSESQLCDIFKVSRITIRKALAELEEKRYIRKRQGLGSFILSKAERNNIHFLNIQKGIQEMGATSSVSILEFDIIADNRYSQIREKLHLISDDYFYHLSLVYKADNQRVSLLEAFINFDEFPGIKISEIRNSDLFSLISRKFGLNINSLKVETSARRTTKTECKYLDVNINEPLISIDITYPKEKTPTIICNLKIVGNLPMYLVF